MGSFQKLKHIIEAKDRILLIAHSEPDGDCLGSLLALGLFFQSRKKTVAMICGDEIPAVFNFLIGIGEVKNDFLIGDFDAVILLDNGDMKRTGFSDRILQMRKNNIPVINIDHHPKNDLWRISSVNHVNEKASSTAEIVYKILIGLDAKISPKIATYLLTGIFTDTGGFQHTNTSKETLEIVADLLGAGAKLKIISENITSFRSVAKLKLWGIALDRLVINKKFGIAYSVIMREDIESVGASDDEVSGLINLINSIPDSRIALLLYEADDGKIKGSLRTESDEFNVSTLAKYLGGGGHRKASGFSLEGRIVKDEQGWRIV